MTSLCCNRTELLDFYKTSQTVKQGYKDTLNLGMLIHPTQIVKVI